MKRVLLNFSLLIIFSCALFIPGLSDYNNAKKQFRIGQFDVAAFHSYNSLLKKIDNKKAFDLFELSFNLATDNHNKRLSELFKISDESKWPEIVSIYKSLTQLNQYLTTLKPIIDKQTLFQFEIDFNDYSNELSEANSSAANYHYSLGIDFKEKSDKANQKKAAINFRLAQDYVPNYLNSEEFYNEARANAVFSLLFRDFEGAGKYSPFIREKVIQYQPDASKEFLRIITRDELKTILSEQALIQSGIAENDYVEMSKLSGADHILGASVLTNYKSPEKVVKKNIPQQKEVTVRTETYVDSLGNEKKKKIKAKVTATVNHFKKTSEASMTLTYKIVDVNNNNILYNGSVSSRQTYFHEWATYKGDKRALSGKFSRLIRREEGFAPSEDKLFQSALESLSKKLSQKISQHYRD